MSTIISLRSINVSYVPERKDKTKSMTNSKHGHFDLLIPPSAINNGVIVTTTINMAHIKSNRLPSQRDPAWNKNHVAVWSS